MGIELVNEDEAETRLLASGDLDDDRRDLIDEAEDEDDDDGELTPEELDEISRRIDDPVRMYLTQMGEIPLLTREQEINLAKKIEITRKKFRRKVLECDYALAAGRRRPQEGPRAASCRSTAPSRSRSPRTWRRTRSSGRMPPQPGDARTT